MERALLLSKHWREWPEDLKRALFLRLTQEAEAAVFPADAVEFASRVLGISLWHKQAEILRSLEANRFTVVEAGHAVGKSLAAAVAVCWWLCTRSPAKVVTTAPTWPQVNFILWAHIRRFAALGLPGEVLESAYWRFGPGKFAIGLSPRKGSEADLQTFQGYHGPNLLVVMDEGGGLPAPFWEAAASLVAGASDRLLVLGNPIARRGPFYEATQNPLWKHIRLSCLEHPNVELGTTVIPGAVSRAWVDERLEDWALECPEGVPGAVYIPWRGRFFLPGPAFEARVLGRPPSEAEDQLIRLAWIERAQARWSPEAPRVSPVFGLDVARFGGAKSVLVCRAPSKVLWLEERQGLEIPEVVAWLRTKYLQEKPAAVFIDEAGVGGGAVDLARREGLPVYPVNMGASALSDRFRNRRAECWWNLREALQNDLLDLPRHDGLVADLLSVRLKPGDRIELEKKEEMMKRLGRSPDYGDALALTYAVAISGEARPLYVPTKAPTWSVPAPVRERPWRRGRLWQ